MHRRVGPKTPSRLYSLFEAASARMVFRLLPWGEPTRSTTRSPYSNNGGCDSRFFSSPESFASASTSGTSNKNPRRLRIAVLGLLFY